MAWRYRCYRFDTETAFVAARDTLGDTASAFAVTGPLPAEEGAEPVPGYFVQAAWPGEPPAAWDAFLIPAPLPGMTVIAGWNEPVAVGPELSKTEFMDLMTAPEQMAMLDSTDPGVVWWRYRAALQDAIDLRNPKLLDALAVLVAGGVLTDMRATRILAGLPPE